MKFYRLPFILLIFSLLLFFSPLSFAEAHKKTIYIYNDEGVSPNALRQAIHTFQTVLPTSFSVKTLNANDVIKNDWSHDAALFVMPGGADLPYEKKLKGAGNAQIKHYVKNGGAYLGLCAGAYYASSEIEFDQHGPLEVLGTRELGFFEGKAIGPALADYDYQTESSARAAKINLHLDHLKEAIVYYNGGGYFEDADQFNNTTVIGSYTNQQPAIIAIKYGEGHVVLSGVHFEYDATLLDSNDPFLIKIIPELKASNHQRVRLINEVLKQLHYQ